MLVSKKLLEKSKVELKITVKAHEFDVALHKALMEYAKETVIPGFRKGKAPLDKVMEKIGRKRVEASAMDEATTASYYSAVQEAGVTPVASPIVDITKYTAPSESTQPDEVVLEFTAETEIVPEIDITGYEKLRVDFDIPEKATEKDLESVLAYLKRQQAKLEDVEDGSVVENGMFADIAFEGSLDGVKRSDMVTKNHPLVVGEGRLIPGFEDHLLGMKVMDKKTFDIVFPKDYHAKELASKKVQFTVKINELKRYLLPNEDADFAKQFGHNDMQLMKKAILEEIQKEKDVESRRKNEEKVLEALNKQFNFDVPDSLVENEVNRLLESTKERLSSTGSSWQMYLAQTGQKEPEVMKQLREQSEKNVRNGFLLGEIMRAEKIDSKEGGAQKIMDRLIEIASKK